MSSELTEREELLMRTLLDAIATTVREAAADGPVFVPALDELMRRVREDLPAIAGAVLGEPLGVDGRPITTGRIFGRALRAPRVATAIARLEVLRPLLDRIRKEHEATVEDYHRASERLRLSGVIDGLGRARKHVDELVGTEHAILLGARVRS